MASRLVCAVVATLASARSTPLLQRTIKEQAPPAFARRSGANIRANMCSLFTRFLRVSFWCWLPVFVGMLLFTVAVALGHGMADFSRANTWVAFVQSAFFSALWSLPPALVLAVLVSVALYRRSGGGSVHSAREM